MTTKQQETLNALLEAALEMDEADPHVLARMTFESLPVEIREALAFRGWAYALRLQIRRERADHPSTQSPDELGLLRVYVAGAEKRWDYLRDLSLADVEAIAESYRERAAQNTAIAARYERLAKEMRKRRVETVGDLDEATVEGILSA